LQGQRKYYEKLLEISSVFQIHVGSDRIENIISTILETITKNKVPSE
jgi:hypothetical protein